MPRNFDPFGGAGQDGASSRRDERSGLLDIRALSSVIDAQRRARTSSASASSVALPAFTSPWLLQDVSAPAPAPARSKAAPRRAAADQRPLHLMILGLSAAVVSLGAYAVLRPAPPVVVEQTPVVVAGPAVPEALEPEPEPAQDPAAVAAPPGDEASEVDEPSETDESSKADEASDAEPKTKRSRAHRSRTPRSRAKAEPKTKPKTEPKTKEPKDGGLLPVECVIDPSKCSKGKRKGSSDAKALGSTKGLPATPSSSQIRSAIAKVKPQAKACRGRHGGRDGEKVRVKLSVEGATGHVTSAKPLEDHARTALGRCVADALAKAELPRFSKPQAGVVYAITL